MAQLPNMGAPLRKYMRTAQTNLTAAARAALCAPYCQLLQLGSVESLSVPGSIGTGATTWPAHQHAGHGAHQHAWSKNHPRHSAIADPARCCRKHQVHDFTISSPMPGCVVPRYLCSLFGCVLSDTQPRTDLAISSSCHASRAHAVTTSRMVT